MTASLLPDRKTMISAASIFALFHHQRAARDLLVIFVEKFVAAGFLRAHVDDGIAASRSENSDQRGKHLCAISPPARRARPSRYIRRKIRSGRVFARAR